MAINSFSHFKDPAKSVIEAKRVLKEGGLFILVENEMAERDFGSRDGFDSHNSLKKKQIKELFLKNGFMLKTQRKVRPYYFLMFEKVN